MPKLNMLKYFINILFLLLSFSVSAQEIEEMEEEETTKPVSVDSFSQVRLSFDVSRPVWNYFLTSRQSYEFAFDYYFKKDLYFVAEAGWGNATVDYIDLKYNTSNTFFRLGINKSLLKRQSSKDWDMGFVGVRYGLAPIQRSVASYIVIDSFWGSTAGTIPAKNMTLHWAEVTAGVNVEVWKGLFAGWTIRGKFRINKGDFKELPPYYVTGYGKGDKGSVFDFNFYLGYAIRWRRVQPQMPAVTPVRPVPVPVKDTGSNNINNTAPARTKGLKGLKESSDKPQEPVRPTEEKK
jgi:hypothetical protein